MIIRIPKAMKASNVLIEALKGFEALKLYAYRDCAGRCTIGYGHIKDVRMGQAVTKTQAEAFLIADLGEVERYVNELAVCHSQGEFDALVDFAFNLGIGKLGRSTLLTKIRCTAPTSEIQTEFKKWVYAGGVKQGGRIKRRNWEALRWAE